MIVKSMEIRLLWLWNWMVLFWCAKDLLKLVKQGGMVCSAYPSHAGCA